MLTTTTNTRFSYLRRVMLLPLLLTSISIFSVRVHAKEKIETKIDAISNSIFHEKVDTSKPPPLPPLPPNLKDIIKNTKKLVLVDGIEANKNELKHTLNPNEINRYEIEFVPAEEALKKYGSKGQYGAIAITHVNHFGKNHETVNSDAQIPAKFPGGLTAWVKYLEGNVNRDIPVNKGAPPGNYTVLLSFIVDKNGGVSDVKAENDPGYGTAEEAKRVIIKGPNWIPAKLNGLNVIYRHKQSITFVVSEEKRVV